MHHLRAIDLSFADSRAPQLPEFPAVLLTLAKLEALHISSAGQPLAHASHFSGFEAFALLL